MLNKRKFFKVYFQRSKSVGARKKKGKKASTKRSQTAPKRSDTMDILTDFTKKEDEKSISIENKTKKSVTFIDNEDLKSPLEIKMKFEFQEGDE